MWRNTTMRDQWRLLFKTTLRHSETFRVRNHRIIIFEVSQPSWAQTQLQIKPNLKQVIRSSNFSKRCAMLIFKLFWLRFNSYHADISPTSSISYFSKAKECGPSATVVSKDFLYTLRQLCANS